ncbi:nuclear transport factor 2 family protein [Aquimarina sp. U1-2]|uniref:nuclear transport factor 2 family protein n=1 Tax=Aquimarina sp. U1-2 TaxID=2823141 RepID=UPI001AECA9B1|nr:nuclear transport factor 2 family protein [Aquimarina sp. U1-2]MBP2833766.1 nuclear transport factor 2 family protein [Aquimarina sp. U1-2]
MKTALTIIIITILSMNMNAQETLKFKVIGGYQFAEGYAMQNNEPLVYAQAGQLTGSWHWEFENGKKGNTHINGATANRVLYNGENELMGTMKINMFEFEGSASGSDLLFLSYKAQEFTVEGSKVTIKVSGEFTGGTGKYQGARGWLTVTSINGFFDDGEGEIYLGKAPKITKEKVRQWTEDYFKATQSGDAETWANSFAGNAYINDPYGSPAPNNREEIVQVGQNFMSAFKKAGLYPDYIFVDGLIATSKWTGRGITKEGDQVTFEGINVTTYNEKGQITSHIGYWDPTKMKVEK